MVRGTPPDALYEFWRSGQFSLISCEQQLDEIKEVTRRPALRERLIPSEVGRMVNDIRRLALLFDDLPSVDVSPDPDDNFLLALASVASANYVVTGDKNDLLALKSYRGTSIVTARHMVELLR